MTNTYIIVNTKTSENHIMIATNISEVKTWVINHLDMSLNWTIAPVNIEELKNKLNK